MHRNQILLQVAAILLLVLLHLNVLYFIILLCLTPNDLTGQGRVLALNGLMCKNLPLHIGVYPMEQFMYYLAG
jgi:hypothetical protein